MFFLSIFWLSISNKYFFNTHTDEYSSASESAFFTSISEQHGWNSIKGQIKYSKNTANNSAKKDLLEENVTDFKEQHKPLPFYLLPQTNRNAIQSTTSRKSIDLDLSHQPLQKSTQPYIDNLLNNEPSHTDIKSIIKGSYEIPSPTIVLPGDFSTSPKSISNKIHRSSPMDSHRNLLLFNQPNTFHLKNRSIDQNEEDTISVSSMISLNLRSPSNTTIISQQLAISHNETLNHISSPQQIFSPKQLPPKFIDKPVPSNRSVSNSRISLAHIVNDIQNTIGNHPTASLSQDFESTLLKSYYSSSFDPTPQIKPRQEIKHEFESLWKTKLTLKTLLSMANRDEAQALKDRKPIDYQMFLTNKFNKNSIFHYNDHIDTKFTANHKQSIVEPINQQDYRENRKLYKRLLNTMGLRKPKETKSITSIKQIKTKKKRVKTIPVNTRLTSDEYSTIDQNEKPLLITYEAMPVFKI